MRVLCSNQTGWFWDSLARETGRLGHLYSPGAQREPRPWFPYALDVGVYPLWDKSTNTVDMKTYEALLIRWRRMLVWASVVPIKPMWAVIPDVPGNADATVDMYRKHSPLVSGTPRALAVQNGMTPDFVKTMSPVPDVICVGGSDDWKWSTWTEWVQAFPRVHVLRCNAPDRLYEMEAAGVESTDGTGWNRGDRKQTQGLEEWARSRAQPVNMPLWPHVCRQPRVPEQESFA